MRRKPRRVVRKALYNPYIEYFKAHPTYYNGGRRNKGIPPAYHCNVTRDLPPQTSPYGESFRADCCNPHCDGEVVNRFSSPWCMECNGLVTNEWKKWFWSTQSKKAFKRLVKDVFE